LSWPRLGEVHYGRILWFTAVLGGLSLAVLLAVRAFRPQERPFLTLHVPGSGLVTNSFATWHPTDTEARRLDGWVVTSGSLYARDGSLWSGIPDDVKPNRESTNGTGSNVFRLYSDHSYADIEVRFDLDNLGFAPTAHRHAWDGFHIFLRAKDEYRLYVISVNRRDGTASIKKKITGGPSNGGTYEPVAKSEPSPFAIGKWQHVRAIAVTNQDGSVTLSLYINGKPIVTGTDIGDRAKPLDDGRIGLRADNDEFAIRNLRLYRAK
jgi:hypothetical protein